MRYAIIFLDTAMTAQIMIRSTSKPCFRYHFYKLSHIRSISLSAQYVRKETRLQEIKKTTLSFQSKLNELRLSHHDFKVKIDSTLNSLRGRITRDSLRIVTDSKKWKRNWSDPFLNDPKVIIYSIIGANIVVYLCWYSDTLTMIRKYASTDRQFRQWMYENFTCNVHLVLGKNNWWTLVTSAFSHKDELHIFFNMYVLHSFGTSMIQIIGGRNFIALYLMSGIVSSMASCLIQHVKNIRNRFSLGASGSISGSLRMIFICRNYDCLCLSYS